MWTIFDAVQPHHREDRAELDHHGEHAAGIVEAEQPLPEDQMRGRRDRQELREPLHRRRAVRRPAGHERARLFTTPDGVRASRVFGAGPGAERSAADAAAVARLLTRPCQRRDDRRGDEHARVGAGDDADDHREGEAVQHLAAEQEQRDGHSSAVPAVITVRPSVWFTDC